VSGSPPRWRRGLRYAVQAILTLGVTAFVFDRVGLVAADFTAIDPGRWDVDAPLLVGSVATLAAGYGFSGWLWARMVAEMGGPQLPLGTAIRVYMVANLGRYVPGKVLQIAGLAWLARREGVAPGTSMGAAVVGQGTALLGATVIGLGAFFGSNESYRAVGWIGVGVTALFVGVTSVPASAGALDAMWRRIAGSGGRESKVDVRDVPNDENRSEGRGNPVSRPGFGFRWTAWYALNWGVYAAAFWLLFLGLEAWAPFLSVGPAFAAAYLVGYAAVFAPAGVGVREVALVVFLLPVLPRDAALALAVASRVWTTAVELLPAAVLAVIQARKGAVSPSHSDVGSRP
jgi:uncharacterized membrane protein YbhN (UPF0104 family)